MAHSIGKLPRSGGMGLPVFCPPPGPPKLIVWFVWPDGNDCMKINKRDRKIYEIRKLGSDIASYGKGQR